MRPRKIRISPSILSADFTRIHEAVYAIGRTSADMIHCDVMDGVFVPNLTFGPKMIADMRSQTSLPLDVHLMVEHPESCWRDYADAGADIITFHLEACRHAHRLIQAIKDANIKVGISLVPSTPVSHLSEILKDLDQVLVMSVNPGFGGQMFIQASTDRIFQLCQLRKNLATNFDISVDGGINLETASLVNRAGADILVTGNAFFSATDKEHLIAGLRKA